MIAGFTEARQFVRSLRSGAAAHIALAGVPAAALLAMAAIPVVTLLAPASVTAAPGARSASDALAVVSGARPPVHVGTFDAAPRIDGVLDDEVWRRAARLEGFVQTQPGDNIAPSFPTIVYLGFDARSLYVGLRAYDDSARVRATLATRDDILEDDFIAVYLDTFGDRRRAYVLDFNPLGIQQDGVYVEGAAGPDYSVDVVMFSRGRVDAAGWTVEAAIPLGSLRYASGRQWNVQVQRRIKHRDDEQDSWTPLVRGVSGFLTQAGSVSGFEELPARRAVELIPSVTTMLEGARAGVEPAPDAWREAPARADVGVSAKLGITPDVTVDVAVNPDFAQVEADAPVITANQRFPVLFEEKRPFFLESIDLFRTPILVVHTRTIVDPVAAVKLTGKRGASAFGLLLASDEAPGRFTDAERSDSTLQDEVARLGGRNSAVGVLRLRREVGGSTLGLLGTGYHFVDRDNVTAGSDVRIVKGKRGVATLQVVGTWARRRFYDPDTDRDSLRTGRGLGYAVDIRSTDRHLNVTLLGRGRSPDYVSEVGFTPQVDVNAWSLETRWDGEPHPGATLIRWSFSHTAAYWFDWRGRSTYGFLWPHLTLTFPLVTTTTIGPYVDYQRLFEEEFGPRRNATQAGAFAGSPSRRTVYHGGALVFSTTPAPRWNINGSVDWSWNAFDYDFGAGPEYPRVSPAALADPNAPLDPGPGRTFDGAVSVVWRPTVAWRIAADYTHSRLRRNDTGRLAYVEQLVSAQTVVRFGRFASVRLRGDYQASRSNLRPQVLVAWTPNPGTAVYAGYNDDLNRDGWSPITGISEPGLHRNARTVFVKASLLLRATWR